MWQRSQTLFFAIATGLLVAMFFSRMAIVYDGAQAEALMWYEHLPFAILIALGALASLLCTFAWGHRILQMRVGVTTAVVLGCLQVWVAIFFIGTAQGAVFRISGLFPLAALFFEVLALRGVWADELLVRSSSRLRSARPKDNKKKGYSILQDKSKL